MARSRFVTSADHSVTACPSTHDTICSLESSFSGATSPASARAAAAAYSGFSADGAPPHAERATPTTMKDRLRVQAIAIAGLEYAISEVSAYRLLDVTEQSCQ